MDVVGRLKEESVREDEGEDAGMDVDGLLKRNWKRVDMLRQLQVGRVMRGEDKAGEAEENLGQPALSIPLLLGLHLTLPR